MLGEHVAAGSGGSQQVHRAQGFPGRRPLSRMPEWERARWGVPRPLFSGPSACISKTRRGKGKQHNSRWRHFVISQHLCLSFGGRGSRSHDCLRCLRRRSWGCRGLARRRGSRTKSSRWGWIPGDTPGRERARQGRAEGEARQLPPILCRAFELGWHRPTPREGGTGLCHRTSACCWPQPSLGTGHSLAGRSQG